jgi:Fibrobacter succinogenes major domain (Fib_succ_major)
MVFQINSCEKESQVVVEDSEPVSDIDGNVYKTVNIGGEIWMAENLRVSHFRNGDLIPEAKTTEEWVAAGTKNEPAWCYVDNDPRGLDAENWTVPDNTDGGECIGTSLARIIKVITSNSDTKTSLN